jgi:hypothetical protein
MFFVAADGKTTGSRFWVINRFSITLPSLETKIIPSFTL